MEFILEKYHRRSIRLKGYDYSRPGYYFVTICTRERECLLGEITSSTMLLNEMGKMAERTWNEIATHFPNVVMDQCMIMPNHFHGIIRILEQIQYKRADLVRGLMNQTPTPNQFPDDWILTKNPKITLGKILRFFKAKSALEIRNKTGNSFYWQRNYFEYIVRDKSELFRIRNYIRENPVNWPMDEDNPLNVIKE